MSHECELCGDNFTPTETYTRLTETHCQRCRTDPFRDTLRRIYEVVGLSHYTLNEIRKLNTLAHNHSTTIEQLKQELKDMTDYFNMERRSNDNLKTKIDSLETDNARLRGRVNICIDLVQKMLDGDTFTKGFLAELRAALKPETAE